MSAAFEFTLNGKPVRVEAVSPNTTLLEFLRGSGLTGSKEGCAEGDCGACSVAIIERGANGKPTYRAVNSCLMPVCLLAGREVVSVEGVGCSANMHPVQRTMAEGFGSQCGYCTPGFICSMFEGYYRDDLHTPDDLDEQLAGNLCRCTGYRPIRDAAIEAFLSRSSRGNEAQTIIGNRKTAIGNQSEPPHVVCYEDKFAERLKSGDAKLGSAEYEFAGEKFLRPTTLRKLLVLLKKFPEARIIAGATELGLDITKRYKKFPTLISTEAVSDLKKIRRTADEWQIGAAVTLTEIEDNLGEEFPALGDMLRVFGSRQIRNRATMGGNLVTASPIGDSAPVLLALDAKVVLVSSGDAPSPEGGSVASTLDATRDEGVAFTQLRRGVAATIERILPINEFFVAYRKTALQPGEVLKTIIIPRGISKLGLTRKFEWFKVSKRREMDISTVAGAFVVDLDSQNIVRHVRLGYGGVAAMPARAQKTEAALLGKPWSAETIANVLPILQTEFTPISDVRGTAEYRNGLIVSLLEKFFAESSEGRVPRARKSGEGSLGLAEIVPPKQTNRPPPHESAHKHVTGEAMYVDDRTNGMLETWPVCSTHAKAKILKRDATAARLMPGIKAVLLAEDIPGLNDIGTKRDEVLLADKEVYFHGQLIALVVGESLEACRNAAEKVTVEYEPLPVILTIEEAIAQNSFHNDPNFMRRGNVETALGDSPMMLEGEFSCGGQEHFYLEMQAAWAEPGEDGSVSVVSSTQHPSEVQVIISHVLNLPCNKVVVQSPRMGGGFGGKETQAATPAALVALAATKTGAPVRFRYNRDQDMMLTGKRHPFLAKFKIGFDAEGMLLAAQAQIFSNGGWAQDLSQAVTDRALFHFDNCYYIPNVDLQGRVAKTNVASNTAFRGFGGPQGMLIIEEIIDRIARRLGVAPELIREKNLYRGTGETNTTHYGQEIEDNRIQMIWNELKKSAELEKRRDEIRTWNQTNPNRKRGIAMTPVKFGISFTVTHLNQAGALVLLYQDGTAQVNHGGTEMGQGIHTNMVEIVSRELGLKRENIRVMNTSTDKVPNTSATAASCGTDLNGAAVKNACEILRARLAPVAAEVTRLASSGKNQSLLTSAATNMVFAESFVFHRDHPDVRVSFAEVVKKAYLQRVSLSANGFYATSGIHWDRNAGKGKPFHYFSNGAAVTEVEVDGFTGMAQVLRTDILQDVGDSLNEGVNRGQVEGGFVQGMGWLTGEELKWDDKGKLLTHSPDTYKIPAVGDAPKIFNVSFLKNAAQKNVVYGTKAIGEPPLMLAISVREAIRDAVAAFGKNATEVSLASPATCEAIFMAIRKL